MLKTMFRLMTVAGFLLAVAPVPIGGDEGRIPIFAAPSVLLVPGQYILVNNLSMIVNGSAIVVGAPNVDIDLNGFTVSGLNAPTILVSAGPGQIVIRNGHLLGGTDGIQANSTSPGQTIVIEEVTYDGGSTGLVGINLATPEKVVLRRNAITSVGTGINLAGGFPVSGSIEDNTIVRCTSAIVVAGAASLAIDGNRVTGSVLPSGSGITVSDSQGVLVTRNTLRSVTGVGIDLLNTHGSRLTGNIVRSSGLHGIRVDSASSTNTVNQNVCTRSGMDLQNIAADGLLVDGTNNRLDGNVLNDNLRYGLNIQGAGNVFGKNMARGNLGSFAGACGGTPALFPPESCNNGAGNTSFGDNLIPGPPIF